MQAEQVQRNALARAEALLISTAAQIFAGLVIAEWSCPADLSQPPKTISPDVYRGMARIAREAAPYFGEVFGICQVNPAKGNGDQLVSGEDQAPRPPEVLT